MNKRIKKKLNKRLNIKSYKKFYLYKDGTMDVINKTINIFNQMREIVKRFVANMRKLYE